MSSALGIRKNLFESAKSIPELSRMVFRLLDTTVPQAKRSSRKVLQAPLPRTSIIHGASCVASLARAVALFACVGETKDKNSFSLLPDVLRHLHACKRVRVVPGRCCGGD